MTAAIWEPAAGNSAGAPTTSAPIAASTSSAETTGTSVAPNTVSTDLATSSATAQASNVHTELSMVESGFLWRDALRHLPADRLLLGTHAPIHMIDPSVAKLASDELEAATHASIASENFDRFFASRERLA